MNGALMGFRIRLRFPGCRTLKDRRQRVEGFIHRAKERHGFSAADWSDPLKADYAEIGLAAVGRDEREIQERFNRIVDHLSDKFGETEILGVQEFPLTEET